MPSFDDPAPARDTRKMLTIYLRPSLKIEIDRARGKLTRSEWFELAIVEKLQKMKEPVS